jgi:hypothetical protein
MFSVTYVVKGVSVFFVYGVVIYRMDGCVRTCAGRPPPSAVLCYCVLYGPDFSGFLLGLIFDTEGGGEMFLRNVGSLSTDYAPLYPRR